MKALLFCGISLYSFLIPNRVAALPNVIDATAQSGVTTVTLRLFDQTMLTDSNRWCEIDLLVAEDASTEFSEGDTIEIEMWEDDGSTPHDFIWSTIHTVTSTEVTENRVDRSFDCHSNFGSDGGGPIEIYLIVLVNKSACVDSCSAKRGRRQKRQKV